MCKINKPVIDVAATAQNIKACRIKAGYTVRQLQSIFNFTSPQAIYNWEKGRDIPTVDNLIVLAEIYDISVDDIIITRHVEIECSGIIKKTA